MSDKACQLYLSLIIPAFNEEARIGKSLDRILSFLQCQSYSSEVIIVDDGSQDRTSELVRERLGKDSRIKIYQQSQNLGKGEAVKQGMLHSAVSLKVNIRVPSGRGRRTTSTGNRSPCSR